VLLASPLELNLLSVFVFDMDRHELALKVASHWVEVLGGPLRGKSISVSFAVDGYFPDDWTIAAWKLPFQTREVLPEAVAHLLRDGRAIPEKEVREAVLRNAFDSIEILVFQVPERDNIPKWVEEKYFVRGILRALLKVRYPDWNERQLANYEEKLTGKKVRGRVSITGVALYTCALVSAVFLINFAIVWVLNGYTTDGIMPNLCFAIMIEGLFIAAYSLTLIRTLDVTVSSPSGRTFLEHVRFPPMPTMAVASFASGMLLFFIGLFLLS
jgi:hypothetical protein